MNKAIETLYAVAFMIITATIFLYAVYITVLTREWESAQAVIIDRTVTEYEAKKVYVPNVVSVSVKYIVGNRQFSNTSPVPIIDLPFQKAGKAVTVLYDPLDPTRAIVGPVWLYWVPVFLIATLTFLLWSIIMGVRKLTYPHTLDGQFEAAARLEKREQDELNKFKK